MISCSYIFLTHYSIDIRYQLFSIKNKYVGNHRLHPWPRCLHGSASTDFVICKHEIKKVYDTDVLVLHISRDSSSSSVIDIICNLWWYSGEGPGDTRINELLTAAYVNDGINEVIYRSGASHTF